MTPTQRSQFNRMRAALRHIGTVYMTPAQIQRDQKNSGLSYTEYLELSYENIQGEARAAVKGVKEAI